MSTFTRSFSASMVKSAVVLHETIEAALRHSMVRTNPNYRLLMQVFKKSANEMKEIHDKVAYQDKSSFEAAVKMSVVDTRAERASLMKIRREKREANVLARLETLKDLALMGVAA